MKTAANVVENGVHGYVPDGRPDDSRVRAFREVAKVLKG